MRSRAEAGPGVGVDSGLNPIRFQSSRISRLLGRTAMWINDDVTHGVRGRLTQVVSAVLPGLADTALSFMSIAVFISIAALEKSAPQGTGCA